MADEIKPALTAEEWAQNAKTDHGDGIRLLSDAEVRIGTREVFAATKELHALAALALHGQPFGFTWNDVDIIDIAAACDYEGSAKLCALRDRIAALLPPREAK